MHTQTCAPENFPTEEIFRAELVATLAVATRKEIASALDVTPQGVGLWDRGEASPPGRKRRSFMGKLQALRNKKGRTRGAK